MIKVITAYTFEIDDTEAAVSELLDQLDIEHSLCTHSVGIMACYPEFIETGVVRELCKALPFDVIGCTTAGNTISGILGEMMLSLMVLTSDDLLFSTGVSAPLTPDMEASLGPAYQEARYTLPRDPALIIAFAPLLSQVTGDLIVKTLDRISGGVPIFGAMGVDYIDIIDFSRTYTLFNGEAAKNTLPFLLICGDIHPSFFVASIPNEKVQKQKAVITKSEGNLVMEVNGMTMRTYLENLGILGLSSGTSLSFTFMVDYQDGTPPLPRSTYFITPEGYVAFGGDMPIGATMAVGDMDSTDVLHTAMGAIKESLNVQNSSCLLLFSCLTRYIVLDANTTGEMELLCALINDKLPYHFFYTGGEICPVYTDQGTLLNRSHNCSFIICAF